MDITFIIPTLNEVEHIGFALESIFQHCPSTVKYEVIVVDNGSTDGTLTVAAEKGAKCLYLPNCAISSLRNRGAKEAASDVLIFLDADVYLDRGWKEEFNNIFWNNLIHEDLITGSIYGTGGSKNWIERFWFYPRSQCREVRYINGGHLILRRNTFHRIGGFDPTLETGEDVEFCDRAVKMGVCVNNNPLLRVIHAGYPKTLGGFFSRERWHARGDYKSVTTVLSSRPAIISVIFSFLSAAGLTSLFFNRAYWPYVLLLEVSFVFVVSIAAAAKRCDSVFTIQYLCSVLLYVVYFTARSVSFLEFCCKRSGFLLLGRRTSRDCTSKGGVNG